MPAIMTVGIVIAVFFLIIVIKSTFVIRQAEAIIIERVGKFHDVLTSGLHIVIPFIDRPRTFLLGRSLSYRIDLREQVMDFAPQEVITHDNVKMTVDSVIYFRIIDPEKACYGISNIVDAIEKLATTTLRNLLGALDLDSTLTSRERINSELRMVLDEATEKWGVKVTRVELKNIFPPPEIERAMAMQMKAERERRAIVTEAEGTKTAQVLRAEGEKGAAIAEAEGDKQAKILRAEAEATAIMKVAEAKAEATRVLFKGIHDGRPTKGLIAIKYLETMEKIADSRGSKIFIPYEASGILAAVSSVGEVLREKGGTDAQNV